jgi:hypothetical protein
MVPESAMRPPQPLDLIRTYVTYSEVVGLPPPDDYVSSTLLAVRRLDFVSECAGLLGAYEKLTASRPDLDRFLTDRWFKDPARGRIHELLKDHSTLVAPQTLLLLMQFSLLNSPDDADGDARPHPLPGVILALQDQLGSAPSDEPTTFTGDPRSPLFRQIIASQHFGQDEDEVSLMAHHHERWVRLASQFGGQPNAVDLLDLFRRGTGVHKDDFTTVGLAIWAHCETHASYPIPAAALGSFLMEPDVVTRALDLISADEEGFRRAIAGIPDDLKTEWSVDTIRRYPILRLPSGDLLVLSKRLLLERIYGWLPMFDLKQGLKGAGDDRDAGRADAWFRHLCELDARNSLVAIAGQSRCYDDEAIQRAFGTATRNADAAVEYHDAWVVVEVGTHQLTRSTVVASRPEALESDLREAIDDKAAQLDATIKQLLADECRLTGGPPRYRRRYLAALVLTEGFPVNPMTMAAVRERLRAAGLLTDPRIGPLHILDQEELDMAEATCENEGASFAQLLEAQERSSLVNAAFKDWLILDRGHGRGPKRPARLQASADAAWEPAIERLRKA